MIVFQPETVIYGRFIDDITNISTGTSVKNQETCTVFI